MSQNSIDVYVDVNVDAETQRSLPLTFGIPPEAEGDTCGVDFFGEAADSALTIQYVPIPGPPGPSGAPGAQGDPGPAGPAGSVNADGFQIPLGPIATEGDGSWTPGAVPLSDTVSVSEAVDRLNEVLGLLVPAQPPAFPNGTLSISNSAGSSPVLAGGVADNTGNSPYTGGGVVTRIAGVGASTFVLNDVGPGNNGTIQVYVNGTATDSHTLTGSGDNGAYGALVLGDQKDFPVGQPGFWKSIDVSISGAASVTGVNKLKITHSAAGATNEAFYVRDGLTAGPTISNASVAQAAVGAVAYSSSVPHYNAGAQLTVAASVNNIAGETYYGGADPFVISATGGIFSTQTYAYPALGLSLPIARQTVVVTALTPQTISIDGNNVHGVGQVQGTAKNVNGSTGAQTLSTTLILVKRGSASGRIDETSVTVSGLGSSPNANNAVRATLGAGDTPAGGAAPWNSASALPTYEAAVVAGVLKHDQTNYAVGYLPAGPNLSLGRTASQYVTFTFSRSALSAFKIVITGSYAGCWVRLPGVSDQVGAFPNAPNGWMNAFAGYDGAGVPGKAGDTAAGCALGTPMSGGSGAFQITFGTESSTHSTGNEIDVRLKLNAGQSVTALAFTN